MMQFLISTDSKNFRADLEQYVREYADQYGETARFEVFEVDPPLDQRYTAVNMKKII